MLLSLSNLRNTQLISFSDVPPSGERFDVSSVAIGCGTSQKGWVLTLRDCAGEEVGALMSRDTFPEPRRLGPPSSSSGSE